MGLSSLEDVFSSVGKDLSKYTDKLSVQDMIFNHLDQYGHVRNLSEDEKEDMGEDEIKEYNKTKNNYNRAHKFDIQEMKDVKKQESDKIKNDPSMQ